MHDRKYSYDSYFMDRAILSACRSLDGCPYQRMIQMNYTNLLRTLLQYSPKPFLNAKKLSRRHYVHKLKMNMMMTNCLFDFYEGKIRCHHAAITPFSPILPTCHHDRSHKFQRKNASETLVPEAF